MEYVLHRTTSNAAVDQRSTGAVCFVQHHAFSVPTAILGAHVVGRVDGRQQTRKLQIGMHREEVATQILWTIAVLQDASHQRLGI